MATRIVKVTGIAEWAKVFAQNRDLYGYKPTEKAEGSYEKYNGACTINMILDDTEIAKLQAAKFPRIAKPDPEGRGVIVKFDRKFDTGYDWSSGAPTVTKPDGTAWDYNSDGTIGNGSVVEATVAIYDIEKYGSIGSRLESLQVLNHVQYIQPQDDGASPPSTKKPEPAPAEEAVLF